MRDSAIRTGVVIGAMLGPERQRVVAFGRALASALGTQAEVVDGYLPILTSFAIADRARDQGAEVIVISGAEPEARGVVFGPFADRLLRQSLCPILLLRSKGSLMPHRLVAPGQPRCEPLLSFGPFDTTGRKRIDSLQLTRIVEVLHDWTAQHRPVVTQQIYDPGALRYPTGTRYPLHQLHCPGR